MKHRIPAAVDDLMWLVAEDPVSKAREEFDARYPEYRLELARRCDMVRGLKGSRPTKVVPPFEARRPQPPPRQVAWSVGLGLAAIAVASFTVVYLSTRPVPTTPARPAISPTSKPETPAPAVVFTNNLPTPNKPEPEPEAPAQAPVVPAYLQPQALNIKRAPLQTVLKLLASQGKLGLTIAPGMPNPDVAVSYSGKTVIEMLQDLGEQYAFTAFDQGDGTVLIIPARDESSPTGEAEDRPKRRIP